MFEKKTMRVTAATAAVLVLVLLSYAGAETYTYTPPTPWPASGTATDNPRVDTDATWTAFGQAAGTPGDAAWEVLQVVTMGTYNRWSWGGLAVQPNVSIGELGVAGRVQLQVGRGSFPAHESVRYSGLALAPVLPSGFTGAATISGTAILTGGSSNVSWTNNYVEVEILRLRGAPGEGTAALLGNKVIYHQIGSTPEGESQEWTFSLVDTGFRAGDLVLVRARHMRWGTWGNVRISDYEINIEPSAELSYRPPTGWPANLSATDNPREDAEATWTAYWQGRLEGQDGARTAFNGVHFNFGRNRWTDQAGTGQTYWASLTGDGYAGDGVEFGLHGTPTGTPSSRYWVALMCTPDLPSGFQGSATISGAMSIGYAEVYASNTYVDAEVFKLSSDNVATPLGQMAIYRTSAAEPGDVWNINLTATDFQAGDSIVVRAIGRRYYTGFFVNLVDYQIDVAPRETLLYMPPGNWPNSATAPDPNNPCLSRGANWTAFWHPRYGVPESPMGVLTAASWSGHPRWSRNGSYPAVQSLAYNHQKFMVTLAGPPYTDAHGWAGLACEPVFPPDFVQGVATITGSVRHDSGEPQVDNNILMQIYKLSGSDEATALYAAYVPWQGVEDFDVQSYIAPGDRIVIRMRGTRHHAWYGPSLDNYTITVAPGAVLPPFAEPDPGLWDDAHTVNTTVAGKAFSREILGQNWFIRGSERIGDRVLVRGTEGGVFADRHNWQTLEGVYASPGNTLDFLRQMRDSGSTPMITANSYGLGYVGEAGFVYTDTNISTMTTLAADWVRYTNFIAQSEPLTAGDQDILNKIDWGQTTNPNDPNETISAPKLPAPGEEPLPTVRYWQIGNEVDAHPDYLNRYNQLTAAMRAIDPTIKVGPSATSIWPEQTDHAVRLVLDDPGAHVDFVSYHPYGTIGAYPSDEWEARLQAQWQGQRHYFFNGVRATVAAAGRNPDDLEYFTTEWNPCGWQHYGVEGLQVQALGAAETVFAFADMADSGLRGANFWGNVEAVDRYTEYPVFKVLSAMQAYLGDTLLDRYTDGGNLRIYTVRDSETGQVTVWGLNFSNDTAKTMKLSLTGLGAVGSATKQTLAGLYGTGGLGNGNLAGNVVFVDWTSRDVAVNEVDFNEYVIAYEPASITVLVIDPAPLPGDANLDGVVDLHDFAILAAHYGQGGAGWSEGDFTGDGEVGFEDFVVLASNFLAKDSE